jgi:hypothetical protein
MRTAAVDKWYEIHVHGTIPLDVLPEFTNLTATVEPVETVLSGPVPDQAALYGVLTRLQTLGLELLEIRRMRGREVPLAPTDVAR